MDKEIERLESVERIVEKTGCTYAQAKDALELNNWNLLDAIICIEKTAGMKAPSEEQKPQGFTETQREETEEQRERRERAKQARRQVADDARGIFARIRDAVTMNYLTIVGRQGNQILRLPMWALLILLICWFWAMIACAFVFMLFGCRFHFEGRDFGQVDVNRAMDRASQKVYETGQKIHDEFAGKPEEADKPSEQSGEHKE